MVAPEEGRRELFDLVADPGELRNLATEQRLKAEEMSILLESWRSAQGPSQAVPALEPDVRERLKVLGYVE
jgi:hypothetical protein